MISQHDDQESNSCSVGVFHGTGKPIEVRRINLPTLSDEDVLVRITDCTICGSDLHTYYGRRAGPEPTVLGHEVIGTIERMGRSYSSGQEKNELQPGDLVTWSVYACCHECSPCENGLWQKCKRLIKYGHRVFTETDGLHGGLAEYILLRKGTTIVKLPADAPPSVFCPANCATSTVMCAFSRVNSIANKRVLVMGGGLLGLTSCALAKVRNASNVVMVDPDESRAQLAKQFGATDALTRMEDLPSADREFDIVFEMSGNSKAVETSIESAAIGGQVVLVGSVFPTSPVAVDPERVVRKLLSIHGVHNYRPCDLQDAVDFLARHQSQFPFEILVEHSFSLRECNQAFDYAAKHRPIRISIRS